MVVVVAMIQRTTITIIRTIRIRGCRIFHVLLLLCHDSDSMFLSLSLSLTRIFTNHENVVDRTWKIYSGAENEKQTKQKRKIQ